MKRRKTYVAQAQLNLFTVCQDLRAETVCDPIEIADLHVDRKPPGVMLQIRLEHHISDLSPFQVVALPEMDISKYRFVEELEARASWPVAKGKQNPAKARTFPTYIENSIPRL